MVTHEKKIEIAKMTQHQAEEIVDTWKHEGIYQFYDMTEDPDVELGLGLKPEYTGKGFGKSFVNIVVDFLISNYHLLKINLSGVSFNRGLSGAMRNGGSGKPMSFNSCQTFPYMNL